MSSVIQHSSSIQNTFISTVDHLPCDIIRSLWLIQACNIAVDRHRQRLHDLLLQLQHDPLVDKKNIINQLKFLKLKIQSLNLEATAEAKALHNQLITHEITLSDEVDELRNLAQNSGVLTANSEDQDKLRAQLIEHYRKNPLTSQKEALKEQDEMDSVNANNQKLTDQETSSGIKLVLRLSKDKTKLKLKGGSRVEISNRSRGRPRIVKPKTNESDKLKGETKPRGRPRLDSKQQIAQPEEPKGRRSSYKVSKPVASTSKHTRKKIEPKEQDSEVYLAETAEDEDNKPYCFCRQPSLGGMIACDNDACPNGEWFHYKCVGLFNRVEAMKYTKGGNKWFCSDKCKEIASEKQRRRRKRKKNKGSY